MKYNKCTIDQKLEILACSEKIGIVEACQKWSLSTCTLYNCKKNYEHKGEAELKVTYLTKINKHKEVVEENVFCVNY